MLSFAQLIRVIINPWMRTLAVEIASRTATRTVSRIVTRWPARYTPRLATSKSTGSIIKPGKPSLWLTRLRAVPVHGLILASIAQLCVGELFRIDDVLVYDPSDPLPQGIRVPMKSEDEVPLKEPVANFHYLNTRHQLMRLESGPLRLPNLPCRWSHCCACTHLGKKWCTDHSTGS